MKMLAKWLIGVLVFPVTACVMPSGSGYQAGQLSPHVAYMPRTGLQAYQPRVPRFVGVAAILSLACVAPNGFEAVPHQKGSERSQSQSPLGNATINPTNVTPCQKPAH